MAIRQLAHIILVILVVTLDSVRLNQAEQVNYDLVKETKTSQQQQEEELSSPEDSLLLRALTDRRSLPADTNSNNDVDDERGAYDGPMLYRGRSGQALLALPIDQDLFDELNQNSMTRMAEKRSADSAVHTEAKKKKFEELIKNRNASAQLMEKKLTEKQKKLITDAITANLIDKLKNMYVVTARSR